MELFQWLADVPYLDTILQLLLSLHGAALIIVNLTNTPRDNEILAVIYRYVEFFAGIVRSAKVKQPSPFEEVEPKETK
jgi:hypothetical protein